MTLGLDSHFELARDVQCRRFHEELVLLDLARGEYFSLDEIGSRVWEALGTGESLSDVVNALSLDYDTDVARLEADVVAFAAELVQRELLVVILK